MSDLNMSVYISNENLDDVVIYLDGPDGYLKHDVSLCPKAMEISGGVLYADESGEYYLEGVDSEQLLKNPQLLYTGVPV